MLAADLAEEGVVDEGDTEGDEDEGAFGIGPAALEIRSGFCLQATNLKELR